MRMKKNILVIKKMNQEEVKLVQDLTEQVQQGTKFFYDFPKAVKILNSKLYLAPDGWGNQSFFVSVEYEFDGVKYKIEKPVYNDVNDVINDILFEIVDHYRRCHLNQ